MPYTEDKISIKHDGQEYCATYKVDDGIVSVTMCDKEGTYRQTSTFLDGLTVESVARLLFSELLKDMAVI